jgi:NAD kinase
VLTVQPLVEEGRHDVYVTLDGQTGFALSREDIVRVRRAELPLRLIRPTTRSYFEVLRQKLKWAER